MLPIGWLYATYHLLREPETTIELMAENKKGHWGEKKPTYRSIYQSVGAHLGWKLVIFFQ